MNSQKAAKIGLMLLLSLAFLVCGFPLGSVPPVSGEELQEEIWDKFKEVATDEFYNALDEQFEGSDLSYAYHDIVSIM